MTKVTKESLSRKISRLEVYDDLSLSEEYQLEAYRMLRDLLPCQHKWVTIDYQHSHSTERCEICGAMHQGRGNY